MSTWGLPSQLTIIFGLDRVALDGTRVRANVLAAEVSALLADAERIDKDEDATFGKNRRGGVVSEQPRRRETGPAEIGAACEGAGSAAAYLDREDRRRRAKAVAERRSSAWRSPRA